MKKLVVIGALAFTLSSIAAPFTVNAASCGGYSFSYNGSYSSIQSQLKNYSSNNNSCPSSKIITNNGSVQSLEDYGIKSYTYSPNCSSTNQNSNNANSDCNTKSGGSTNSDCNTKSSGSTNSNCNTKSNDTGTKGSETKNSTSKDCTTNYVTKPDCSTSTKQNTTDKTTQKTTDTNTTNNKGTDTQKTEEKTTTTPSTPSTETKDLSFAEQVVELVNVERAKEGLSPLTMDTTLTSAAMVRAKEIQTTFEHTRPNGSSFATAITEAGGSYRGAGENIAYGQRTPQAVVTAWMNSSGHRANIMSKNYTKIGVGYLTNSSSTPYWVQLFSY